jgi:transcriptional regulator with XRE-family HTH domain
MSGNGFGESVKKHRAALGLSQRDMAAELGIKASHVAYIENSRRRPSIDLLLRMVQITGLNLEDSVRQLWPGLYRALLSNKTIKPGSSLASRQTVITIPRGIRHLVKVQYK